MSQKGILERLENARICAKEAMRAASGTSGHPAWIDAYEAALAALRAVEWHDLKNSSGSVALGAQRKMIRKEFPPDEIDKLVCEKDARLYRKTRHMLTMFLILSGHGETFDKRIRLLATRLARDTPLKDGRTVSSLV